MDQSSSSKSALLTGTKKRIKVRKRPSTTSSSNGASNDEEEDDNYLPPAARDSKWVGLTNYNPNFEKQIGDEITDEGEIRLTVLDEDDELPIYNLFPKLREKFPQKKPLSIIDNSTTDITKSLVGQTPNFAHMKKSSKYNPMKLSLPSLKEIPDEDEVDERQIKSSNKNKSNVTTSSSAKKAIKRTSHPTVSNTTSAKEHYDEEDSDSMTNLTARKKRRTKKRTDIPKTLESGSSCSGMNRPLNKQKENMLKTKKSNSKEQKTIRQHSSQGSLADEESV